MFFTEWHILVVDDEPDVLAVTKLALKDVRVYSHAQCGCADLAS